jgi:hypothetical protein
MLNPFNLVYLRWYDFFFCQYFQYVYKHGRVNHDGPRLSYPQQYAYPVFIPSKFALYDSAIQYPR